MATTRAPAALASWTAAPPTAPVAALTSTLLPPGRGRDRLARGHLRYFGRATQHPQLVGIDAGDDVAHHDLARAGWPQRPAIGHQVTGTQRGPRPTVQDDDVGMARHGHIQDLCLRTRTRRSG